MENENIKKYPLPTDYPQATEVPAFELPTSHPQANDVNAIIREQKARQVMEVINMNRAGRRAFKKRHKLPITPPSIIN